MATNVQCVKRKQWEGAATSGGMVMAPSGATVMTHMAPASLSDFVLSCFPGMIDMEWWYHLIVFKYSGQPSLQWPTWYSSKTFCTCWLIVRYRRLCKMTSVFDKLFVVALILAFVRSLFSLWSCQVTSQPSSWPASSNKWSPLWPITSMDQSLADPPSLKPV